MARELAKAIDRHQARDKTKMARFVKLLEELGPDVNEIARRMNAYKETARYWYRKKVVGKGYSILGSAAHSKLGLKRLIIIARVDTHYRKLVQDLFVDMDGLWYVVEFSRTMPDDQLVIHASVPEELLGEFTSFMGDLKTRIGFFTEIEFLPSDWICRASMHAEYHDFEHGQWEFDWNLIDSVESTECLPREQARATFDAEDLLIIRELQVNAARPIAQIAAAINIPYKKALRHYKHVIDRGLISGYRLVWTKIRYLNDERRLVTRKHSYVFCSMIVKDVREAELAKIVAGIEKIPFLWAMCGGRTFLAEFFFPLEMTNTGLKYLRETLVLYQSRMRFFITDWDDTLAFSIPIEMYDKAKKRWTFDREKTIREFETNLDALLNKKKETNSQDILAAAQGARDTSHKT